MNPTPATAATARDEAAPGVYDTNDLVALTKLSLTTVKRLIAGREVPGLIRFGRSIRFSKAAVDRWLAGR